MRTLHIDSGREMRGGQWQALYLVERLGGEAALMARRGSPLAGMARERGVAVEAFGGAALMRIAPGFDIVHAHDARAHTLASLVVRRPVVVSRRVGFPVSAGAASRWKYGRAAAFIAVSEFVKCRLVEAGVPAERVAVVYDGVPLPERAAAGSRILAPRSEDPEKGSALARAAAEAGGFEVCFSRSLAEDLPQAALLLYVTKSEGLGSAALLAMAHGVPVVASRVGGLAEAVSEGETGLLVENEAGAIAAAVNRLRGDAGLRAQMAEAARRRAVERFAVERMVAGTVAVYDRVLSC